jgi:hypothetical protein
MLSRLPDLCKAALATVAFLGLVEAGLQLGGMRLIASITMPDSRLGFKFRPGAHAWNGFEGGNYMRINRLGFEDVERSLQRPAGTLRIAVLGSSIIQSAQTPPEKAFPGVMERALKNCAKVQTRSVEVLNFGVGGYGLPQQWMMLRDEIWKYDPQIVIEAIGLYNDVVNGDRYTSVSGHRFPYFIARDGALIPDEITKAQRPIDENWLAWRNRWRDLENHSKLLLLMENVIFDVVPGQNWQPGLRIDPLQTSTFHPPKDAHLQNAWAVTETSLKLMRDQCAAHHAEFWLVTLDFNIQSEPDLVKRADVFRRYGIDDPDYPDRRLVEFAQREGIRSYWLAPILADYASSHNVALHGFFNTPRNYGHYNEFGDQVVGNLIASELEARSGKLAAPID